MFASSRIMYGWISKFINLSDSKKMWSAVASSSRRLRSASPWLRAVIFGGNMHSDCICGTRLVGLLARLRLQEPLRWILCGSVMLLSICWILRSLLGMFGCFNILCVPVGVRGVLLSTVCLNDMIDAHCADLD